MRVVAVFIDPKRKEIPKGKERITMSEQSRRKAYALIRSLCANYYNGECLPLECDCPQMKIHSLSCKYFREAVLPADRKLAAEIMSTDHVKTCGLCSKPFRALSNAAKYCADCSRRERKRRKAASERKRYHKNLDI